MIKTNAVRVNVHGTANLSERACLKAPRKVQVTKSTCACHLCHLHLAEVVESNI